MTSPMGDSTNTRVVVLAAANRPWAFSQQHPLDTAEFIREAGTRGVRLDAQMLHELYRVGLLAPFVTVTDELVGEPTPADITEPARAVSRLADLRSARDEGRFRDLTIEPYESDQRFDTRKLSDPPGWWNGHLYCWYQVLALPVVAPLVRCATYSRHEGKLYPTVIDPDSRTKEVTERLRRIAGVLTALEARYLPNLDPEWLQLSNTTEEEWRAYRNRFDPQVVLAALGQTAQQVRDDAESLLLRIKDPVGRDWSHLIRRAPSHAWKELTGQVRVALDHRIAAEILLRCYEDLAQRGVAEPLPEIPSRAPHPLHARLSYRQQSLDQDLVDLGISPHPRVVLVVEGETEEYIAPRVWDALQLPHAPELMRVITLRGVGERIVKLGALAAAPLVGELQGEYYDLIKPFTKLLVAVDPDKPYDSPAEVEARRAEVLDEIKLVLAAQEAEADPADLEHLVEIRTWPESCFEFEHFSDTELADAILTIYRGYGAPDRDGLVRALDAQRRARQDIGKVWVNWRPEVSKTALARQLWPTLEAKILDETSANVPAIAQVVYDAYLAAQDLRYKKYILRATPKPTAGNA